MLGWSSGVSLNMIVNMASLSKNEVVKLVASFDKVKTYCNTTHEIDRAELKKLSNLNEEELTALLKLLKPQ